ncbi:MAG TPA: L-erythro-3,5-diaminohexanoate dehydrogenase [Mycobacteriales bacterium]|nr:L-erythro-3,5-diaminohexanoate dehydrogenase [Mycobacteriales bacterium]
MTGFASAPEPARRSSPVGLHRVITPPGALPQAADRLDPAPTLWPDEVRLRVERLNLDAASYRQLTETHHGHGAAIRTAVADIIATRGKMQNPVTGSGGMLVGVVEEVGPDSPHGLHPGQRVATLVSLTLTPLAITDDLKDWDGHSEQVPADGHAILFARSTAAVLPDDLPVPLALAVMDVCGAPALTARVVADHARTNPAPPVVVLGGAGKSGSLALAAARHAGAGPLTALVRHTGEADLLTDTGLADALNLRVVVADARDPTAVADAVGDPTAVTVVCVDTPGCEGGAILATRPGGTIIFFSMATSFSAAALTAEGLAADITMLIGNGYVPGHAQAALTLLRDEPGLRRLFQARTGEATVRQHWNP